MGWQDDPIVTAPAPTPAWMNDPIVGAPQPESPGLLKRALNTVVSGMAGINHGIVSDLAGMPVDAAANALDLLKAGAGYATSKVTGQAPPEWTMPYDRTQVPGTSAWIDKQITDASNAAGIKSPIALPVQNDPLANAAYIVGRGAGSTVSPGATASAPQLIKNAALGGASTGAAESTNAVMPDSPAAAVLASMVPQAAAKGIVAARNLAIRGGEEGRQNMAQRIMDLQNGGIDSPSLGLATGSPLIQGVENLLSKVPGSVGAFQEANKRNFAGMQDKLVGLRDLASEDYGPFIAGTSLQSDLHHFPQRFKGEYNALQDKAMDIVGGKTNIPVDNAKAIASLLTTPNGEAPMTSSLFVQPTIQRLATALQSDTTKTPVFDPLTLTYTNPEVVGIPFNTVKNVRTKIGELSNSHDIVDTPQQRQLKTLYSALSDDLSNAIINADRANAGAPVGPLRWEDTPATNAWNRANDVYSAGMNRVGVLQPFLTSGMHGDVAPEAAYNSLVRQANGNVSTLQVVKKSITPDTRAKIAATLLDEMGTAGPSRQDNTGTVFSPDTFLTNWNKPALQGRNELLSGFPNAGQVNEGAADIAKAASMLKDSSKIWANPSGTGGNVMAGSALGSIFGNLFSNPGASAAALGGLVGGNQVAKRLLLNPHFVKAMAEARNPLDPKAQASAQAEVQNMILNARIAEQLEAAQ